jgi:phage terminase large subunit-like protein
MPDKQLSFGEEIIAWIESNCRCPEGALTGERIKLLPWQRDMIRKIYDNPHGTRRCVISVARKSGKSCFASCLLLVHLVGPAAVPNSQLFSTAQVARTSCNSFFAGQQDRAHVTCLERSGHLPGW